MTNPGAQIFWNSATIEQIYYAKKWWFPAGIAGTAFLALITYLGWWYQRSLRIRFHKLAENIDHVNTQNILESDRFGSGSGRARAI